ASHGDEVAAAIAERAVDSRIARQQTDRTARARAVAAAIACRDVYAATESVTFARRLRARPQVDTGDGIGVHGTEHTADVIRIEQRHTVEQDQILIRCAAAHVHRAREIRHRTDG